MTRPANNPLPHLVELFFRDHLQRAQGASPHTVRAYRDTLRLLLLHLADTKHCAVADLQLDDLQVEAIADFLAHLESARGNKAVTRNCRFAAIRSFFRHLLRQDVANAEQYQRVLSLPTKKARVPLATYLEPEDVHVILEKPDRRTAFGLRDHALLLFLYNTGARVSEALAVQGRDLDLTKPFQVRLHGKGGRDRICPLWAETATALQHLPTVRQGGPGDTIFLSSRKKPLSRDGVAYILGKYVALAANDVPSLRRRRITPHALRHSCAVALLQAGNDITVIRDYLGHASITTTSRYVTTNLKMKREALEAFWKRAGIAPARVTPWQPKPDLLAFLDSL
ncbi:MAG: tyrosine-type recombinase/integrase [Gammaproteobacteria bacterium]|nr:tyrosine-type recombinase/integrase [Gammaproteobacteria bacterium]MDZ7753344.1 tyrosine-type recombinase/integrase [Gammaproteobacteria bacterium]